MKYWFFSVRSSDSNQDKAEGGGQEAGLGMGLHRLALQALPASHTHGKVQDTCPGLSWAEMPLLGESFLELLRGFQGWKQGLTTEMTSA